MLEALQALGVIAQGGQGRVFLAWDRAHRRALAVKVVDVADVAAADRLLARLVGAGSRLARSAFVPIVGHGRLALAPAPFREAFGTPGVEQIYVVMGWVAGPNARELAEAAGSFPAAAVAGLLAQLLSALAELPAVEGHGDLKPENLVVDEAGRVAIVDHPLTMEAQTAGYAPPGEAAGPAADVFAAGRVALCLWTGAFPGGPTPLELLAPPAAPATASAPAQLARERLAALVGKLLDRRREARPAAGDAAVEALAIARDLAGVPADVQAAAALKALRAATPLPERLVKLQQKVAEAEAGGNPVPPAAPTPAGSARGQRKGSSLALSALAGLIVVAAGAWLFASSGRHADSASPAPKSCAVGEIRAPALARFLCADENPRPGYGAFAAKVTGSSGRSTLSLLKSGHIVWEANHPPVGEVVSLELKPSVYVFTTPVAGGDEPVWIPVAKGAPALRAEINGSMELAPAASPEEEARIWRDIQAQNPEKVVKIDRTLTDLRVPMKLREGGLTVVRAGWTKGAGSVTWNVVDDPCTTEESTPPMDQITPAAPRPIPRAAAIWACPPAQPTKEPLKVHIEGYK
ncbi:MAG TPA: phosphotransferase [Myxococcales bacterium]|nr:phosphotransferase [Myxococcales bacterium]